jgi:UDPglucose 6-dehydrogenase|tara:strand:- start:51610 stop:53025 length:1416 start_codon:yes stop_codon:yes gene_type:complete
MNIVVIGAGYVGLVTACCFAQTGNRVICVDHDSVKIKGLENSGIPFHEPGLEALLGVQLRSARLIFETSIARAMRGADVAFLAVGTPSRADGSANLDNLLHCARELANTAFGDCIVVVKSTVPVGTSNLIEEILGAQRAGQAGHPRVFVASNPEFLAEGRAVEDFQAPTRIVVGANDECSKTVLRKLYAPFDPDGTRLLVMDRRSAEFAKYACNAMLAARISMINELSGIAGKLDADIQAVCRVLKGDPRIGASYLCPGVGYGGSCLPKDLNALIASAQAVQEPAVMLRGIKRVNERQGELLLQMMRRHFGGDLQDRRIAIWGLAFKPGTDDVRAAPSLTLIRQLLEEGAQVYAYDPVAVIAAQRAIGTTSVVFGTSRMDVCEGADALVVMTEWDEFRSVDFAWLASLLHWRAIFDARNIYDATLLRRYGLQLYQLGRGVKLECASPNLRGNDIEGKQLYEPLRTKRPNNA